ncbi:MAG: Ig-like domain-containing protein [bacterium]
MKKYCCLLIFILGLLFSFAARADWIEQEILTPGIGEDQDFFGKAVAIDGRYAVVGDPWNDQTASNAGAVFVYYQNDANEWIKQARLLASDGAAGDYFGYSVSISGDYVIVGTDLDDNANGLNAGAAYIFKRSGETWTQQAKIIASDGEASESFGWSVGISGDYAVVGAMGDDDAGGDFSGSAYFFERSGESWNQVIKVLASDGANDDQFGYSVAMSGDWAVIGADRDDDNGLSSGSVYFFKRDAGVWTEKTKVTASDGATEDYFGRSVSISGDYTIAGAHCNDDGGACSGSAYIIKRSDDSWAEQTKIVASDAASNDSFGISVSISGDNALVGAYLDDDDGASSGSAYLFTRSGDSWSQADKFTASDAAVASYFGISVAISDINAVIGSVYESMGEPYGKKQAYIFSAYTVPVADAGENEEDHPEATEISLSGTCTDEDGDEQTGWWTQTIGTACELTGDIVTDKNTGATPLTVDASCTVSVSENETLTFQLSCTDGIATDTDTMTVSVNAAPTAVAVFAATNSGEAKAITLNGEDPGDDELTYTVLSAPGHGDLTGTPPNVAYTSLGGYAGTDTFTFRVSDGLQNSNTATVTITVALSNHAPTIDEDSADYNITFEYGEGYDLPDWPVSDAEEDDITTTWRQVSGPSTLHFNGTSIDTTNFHPKRGTYYVYLMADDGTAVTSSTTIKLVLPNNPPFIDEGAIVIPYSDYNDGVFAFDAFKKTVNITAPFTDYDTDTLTYEWDVSDDDAELVGLSTDDSEATLVIRKTGLITVYVTVTDNQEGETTQEIVLDEPTPDLSLDDMDFKVSTQTMNTDGTQTITGSLQAPFQPVVSINGVLATLTLEPTASLSAKTLFAVDTSDYDTYSFTVANVPVSDDSSELTIGIGTGEDGDEESIVNNEPYTVSDGDDSAHLPLAINGTVSCSLNMMTQAQSINFLFCYLLLLSGLILLRLRKN